MSTLFTTWYQMNSKYDQDLSHQALQQQSNALQQYTQSPEDEQERQSMEFLSENGGWLLKHTRGKVSSSAHKRFFKILPNECRITWGNNSVNMRDSLLITNLETGDVAKKPSRDVPRMLQEYSFVVRTLHTKKDLFLVAMDEAAFKLWTEGLRYMIKLRNTRFQEAVAQAQVNIQQELRL